MLRKEPLRSLGYAVIEMREFDLFTQLYDNNDMKEFLNCVKIMEPINRRDVNIKSHLMIVRLPKSETVTPSFTVNLGNPMLSTIDIIIIIAFLSPILHDGINTRSIHVGQDIPV
uniref:Uncharacterized protein n=1 Tax=Romanomermis culicivorax TaxID=13658 RepID=A0A915J4Y7_ROMCU